MPPLLAALAAVAGTLGGLGGAVLLVPALVVFGMDPADAAPLGLVTVAAGSLAASAPQVEAQLLNQRLGVLLETPAALGAAAGAALAGAIRPGVLEAALAVVAALAGASLLWPRALPLAEPDDAVGVGERVGAMAGAYQDTHGVVAYEATHVGVGAVLFGAVGLVAGLTGTSGGFLKTPVMAWLMRVPVKVAAATTVFMAGVTSSAALLVVVFQGRLDPTSAGPVIAGALAGGRIGATIQERLHERVLSQFLGLLLFAVSVVLVAA